MYSSLGEKKRFRVDTTPEVHRVQLKVLYDWILKRCLSPKVDLIVTTLFIIYSNTTWTFLTIDNDMIVDYIWNY